MSIEIKIHEPPVTFGMLPVGTRFRAFQNGEWWFKFKPTAYDAVGDWNVVCVNGRPGKLDDDQLIDEYHLPPGAELARPKAKLVRVDSLASHVGKDYCIRNGELCRLNAVGTDVIELYTVDERAKRVVLAFCEPVQPCRVEVHVYPEYEQ